MALQSWSGRFLDSSFRLGPLGVIHLLRHHKGGGVRGLVTFGDKEGRSAATVTSPVIRIIVLHIIQCSTIKFHEVKVISNVIASQSTH